MPKLQITKTQLPKGPKKRKLSEVEAPPIAFLLEKSNKYTLTGPKTMQKKSKGEYSLRPV